MMDSKSEQFVSDLIQFYRNRGHHNPQPQQFVARINGKVVNLNQLYSYVIESGGSYKVNQLNLWDDIYCKLFKATSSGANISVALRQVYSRYLLPYEKTFSTNFGNDLLDDDEEESNFSFNSSHNYSHSHSFNSSVTTSLPIASYSHQYQCPQSVSTAIASETRNPLNKLFCSLLSGLPNELDFALKVSTILINSNRFEWTNDYKYINLLLECFKNYCCVCEQNDSLCPETDAEEIADDFDLWTQQNSCNCYQKFWFMCCSDEQTLELVFGPPEPTIEELSQQDFNKIKDKIRLIADIIRNLSFTYDCDNQDSIQSPSPVATPRLMKFLLLLSMSSDIQFNSIALDVMSNIASTTCVIHDDNVYTVIQQILHRRCVEIAMTSNNIHWTSRCLESVSRLFSANVEEINSFLESILLDYEVFTRITELMTCQYDISLLLAILEFCLALSQQKPYMLLKDDNKHLIKILLTLLNCESSQHFTTTALKRMKVIDDRPRVQNNQMSENNSVTVGAQSVGSSANTNSQNTSTDNETFAMNWLRQTYEPNINLNDSHSLKAADLYADYVKHCCRNSRRNVMAAQPFAQLTKRCFPSTTLTNSGTTIEGIVAKAVQNSSNPVPTSQLMSPILKAHLSAPPKNNSTSPVNTNSNCNNNLISNNSSNTTTSTTTTLNASSLPIPTTNTSTLIKSLLANKLRSNATVSAATTSFTPITPTKSATNTSFATLPLMRLHSPIPTTAPLPTTTTTLSNLTTINNEMNGETVVTNSPQLSSNTCTFTTFTTSIPTYSLSQSNTIFSASNATLTASSGQPQQQQFLLVRTIIASPGQQSGTTGLATTGTPVRLILPASMLTQQRLNTPGINGITTSSNVTISAANSLYVNSSTSSAISTNASDLFLKTVLSNSNSANSVPVSPIRSNVKSSPLLNVLLDKGKLPEFSTSAVVNNQMNSFGSANSATLVSSQTPKMYILTTKSPLAMKSLPAIQTQLNQTTQQLTPTVTLCSQLSSQNNTTLKSCLQTSPIVTFTQSPTNTTTTTNHSVVNKQSIPKSCVTPMINGELGSAIHTVNNVVNSVKSIHTISNSINTELHVKTSPTNCVNALNCLPATDLSPIKDMKRAVDDATKLIAKRRNEEENDTIVSNKKLKINSVLTIPSPLLSTNSIPNHDSVISDSILNPINNCVTNNSSQQVLTKASNLLSISSTTPSSAVTTITTITSSNIKNISTINNSNSNKDNNCVNNSNNNITICEFECQWNDCKKTFSRPSEVFFHVHNHHIMTTTFPNVMTCLWGGPEGTGPGCLSKRPKLSLLTHLLDFHCNPNVLQQDAVRKKQLSSVGTTAIVLPQPPAHPGYAHNAALLAIRRHATNYVEAPTLPPITTLTPLTVSIRLTSALILRNLALTSNFVKRTLECFEQYLCELCMTDGRDESRTIAQCLAVITDKT